MAAVGLGRLPVPDAFVPCVFTLKLAAAGTSPEPGFTTSLTLSETTKKSESKQDKKAVRRWVSIAERTSAAGGSDPSVATSV